jgi:hypothetical protein
MADPAPETVTAADALAMSRQVMAEAEATRDALATPPDDTTAPVTALAGDPGDLPARMAVAISHYDWEHGLSGNPEVSVHQRGEAAAAFSVRWEAFIAQAAENAELRAKVEHAEAGAQVSAERLAKAQTEVERLRAELAMATDEGQKHYDRAEEAEAERDALKAAIAALKDDALYVARQTEENAWPDSEVASRARRLIADLDAPETPGDAE